MSAVSKARPQQKPLDLRTDSGVYILQVRETMLANRQLLRSGELASRADFPESPRPAWPDRARKSDCDKMSFCAVPVAGK
jgi:hypothetical protein